MNLKQESKASQEIVLKEEEIQMATNKWEKMLNVIVFRDMQDTEVSLIGVAKIQEQRVTNAGEVIEKGECF